MSSALSTTLPVTAIFAVSLLTGCKTSQVKSAGPVPAVPVSVAMATQESMPIEIHAVGTVEPSAVIQVKSQIGGTLTRVAFAEGSNVKEGDLLFEIDPRPYQEALRQAQASLQRDSALLAQAQANLARDVAQSKSLQADAERYAQLANAGVVSKSQTDQTTAAAESNKASITADQAAIESTRAALESDRTAIDTAKLNLSYCEIHSPVSGRVGNLLVHQGNLIAANSAPSLVTINRLEPIWVSFGVPEEHLAAIRKSAESRQLPASVSLQSDPSQKATGVLSVIDNTVDTTTGTIRLKATFENKNQLLWPGQFVDAALTLGTQQSVVVIPAEAVQPGLRGQMVYVVKPDQTVETRIVTVGLTRGNKVVIAKGLKSGETVVTDGQLRLFPGAKIRPVPPGSVDSQQL